MLLKKGKRLLSILAALVMTLSISSVAMAKGEKTQKTPAVNITGEGTFDTTFGDLVYEYYGTVSALTTKAGYLDLDIELTSDNGIITDMGTITAVKAHLYTPMFDDPYDTIPNYYINQNKFDKKLVTTTITTYAFVTITFQPAEGNPITITSPEPVFVGVADNARMYDVNVTDIVGFEEGGNLLFSAPHDTLNQQ